MSIPTHPEHSLNPTITVCFFCHNDKGDAALLGRHYKGKAPMRLVIDYEPCDDCKGEFGKGILFIEVTPRPNTPDQPPLYKGEPYKSVPYPTGRHWVLTKDAVRELIGNDSDTGQKILTEGRALIDPETAEQLGLYHAGNNQNPSEKESS